MNAEKFHPSSFTVNDQKGWMMMLKWLSRRPIQRAQVRYFSRSLKGGKKEEREPRKRTAGEAYSVTVLGRPVPVVETEEGEQSPYRGGDCFGLRPRNDMPGLHRAAFYGSQNLLQHRLAAEG